MRFSLIGSILYGICAHSCMAIKLMAKPRQADAVLNASLPAYRVTPTTSRHRLDRARPAFQSWRRLERYYAMLVPWKAQENTNTNGYSYTMFNNMTICL